jgi:DNA-nicking Smr family endonuclease
MTGEQMWAAICKTVTPLGVPERGREYIGFFRPHPKKLDLHGYSLTAAWKLVKTFIEETPHKSITIITGNGQMSYELPIWLEQCIKVKSIETISNGGAHIVRLR